jgi:hypothetical protein
MAASRSNNFRLTSYTSPSFSGRIIFADYDRPEAMAKALCRVQEYYENPKLHGQLSSRSKVKSYYRSLWGGAVKRGWPDRRGYFRRVYGCNVPGGCVLEVMNRVGLLSLERELLPAVKALGAGEPFYLIGSADSNADKGSQCAFDHELSHAFYSLSADYHLKARGLVESGGEAAQVCRQRVRAKGYMDAVVTDETVAYLATDSLSAFMGGLRIPSKHEGWVASAQQVLSGILQEQKSLLKED